MANFQWCSSVRANFRGKTLHFFVTEWNKILIVFFLNWKSGFGAMCFGSRLEKKVGKTGFESI